MEIFLQYAALGIDAVLFGVFYKRYLDSSKTAKAVEEAPSFEIGRKLHDEIKSNGVLPYAVVRGAAYANSTPISSQFVNLNGVIKENITRKCTRTLFPRIRIWNNMEYDIQRTLDSVPFVLVGSNEWTNEKICVENPLSAEELVLPTVYDAFVSHPDSMANVPGMFICEHSSAVEVIENMLEEGSMLTGVGEISIENEVLELRPPTSGLTFFLTSLPLDSLLRKLHKKANLFKVLSVLTGAVGVYLLVRIIVKSYQECNLEQDDIRQRDGHEVTRRLFSLMDPVPMCVVCLTNPVEKMIVYCGHSCLCLECSELELEECPVCMTPIREIVPAYQP